MLGAFFHVSEVPVDDVEMQSANHEYKWFSIVQFTKLNNLDGATVKVWSNKNGKKILENLSSVENGLPLILLFLNNKKQQEPLANHFP